jgi:hypothetical protein
VDGEALAAKRRLQMWSQPPDLYWHDTTTGILYVHPTDDDDPDDHTVIVYFWVYFATKGSFWTLAL